MRKAEIGLVRGGITLPEAKKGKLEKILDVSLWGALALSVSGLVYAATHTEEEMNKVRSAAIKPLELLFSRLDEMHRNSMNEMYGDGHFPMTTQQQDQ
ncbi:hypothetical protein KA071_01520 [Candidatus Gracilibacteria bacterium]|nr:hypothetical protein [Candidatus Gracilibacteria bacterium]